MDTSSGYVLLAAEDKLQSSPIVINWKFSVQQKTSHMLKGIYIVCLWLTFLLVPLFMSMDGTAKSVKYVGNIITNLTIPVSEGKSSAKQL